MSYIRIAAVGVGGAILAEAINELLLPHLSLTPLGIVFFIITIIVYLTIHALSCILSMFEAFVHGARLNVVEFFGSSTTGTGFASRRFPWQGSIRRRLSERGNITLTGLCPLGKRNAARIRA